MSYGIYMFATLTVKPISMYTNQNLKKDCRLGREPIGKVLVMQDLTNV